MIVKSLNARITTGVVIFCVGFFRLEGLNIDKSVSKGTRYTRQTKMCLLFYVISDTVSLTIFTKEY